MNNPTIKDVASAAGVSASAVSMFLHGKPGISKATQERIAAAIEELGYTPRNGGRRDSDTNFIALLVEKLPLSLSSDLFYAEVAAGIQAEAERLDYHLAISVLNQPQTELPRLVTQPSIAGVIAIGGGDITDSLLHQIAERGLPLVTVDNQSDSDHLNSVVVDNFRGAYQVTQHLIELGHRRIALIRGPEKYKSLTERYHGYCQALHDAGIPLDPTLIQAGLSKGVPRKGHLEMQQLLRLKLIPTAVFAVSDRTALGAIDAIRERGLIVPGDISVAGFDDINPAAYPPPALTTVSTKRYEMGANVMRRLAALINDPNLSPIKQVMYTNLIVRESTAPCRVSLKTSV
jgi:LacI family transcriptional regulator